MLQSVIEYYRVLQSIAKYYRVLQNIREYSRVFLAHLLGPIFGLVLIVEDSEGPQFVKSRFLIMEVVWIPPPVTKSVCNEKSSLSQAGSWRLVFMVPVCFFMVFHGSRLVFHGFPWFQVGFMVFHGFRLIFHGS